jgi:mono/diheme cytochrome c family protein
MQATRSGAPRRPWLALAGLVLWGPAARAQEAADYFRQHCVSCHTIGGGRLTGPDLKGVTQRRERAWLEGFINNPKGAVDSGDPLAKQLVDEAHGVIMPRPPEATPEKITALVDLIEAESALPESQFVGLQVSDQPFTPEDEAKGRALFTGRSGLENGGTPCVACHTTGLVGGLGGGKLAPRPYLADLTRVEEKLGGRKALAAWLLAPATPTMQGLFKTHALQSDEILPLVAFIEASASAGEAQNVGQINLLLLGLAGAVGVLLGIDAAWRGRFRAVRRPLLEASRRAR